MARPPITERDRITIAILALGGQGGGVLADWIIDIANANGYIAQGTSVPGVAQRTGSTVYYIEMVRATALGGSRRQPVLAMMPVPGDVDIVLASELMEAGRAILRGFVTADRTTLVGSTHRIYAISEKSAPGDGRAASERILDAARRRARRFVGFDMDAAATRAGCVISSIMLGALAGSNSLPFERNAFEAAIRRSGRAVEANLRGFGAGATAATRSTKAQEASEAPPAPTSAAGRALATRIGQHVPEPAHRFALEGAARLMDFQDAGYAKLYVDRLAGIAVLDDGSEDWRLSRDTARYLALAMAYDDTIRVADLKVRATRSARVESEVGLKPGQVLAVTEYMHPRLQEICETLPAGLGRAILGSPFLVHWLDPLFRQGRYVRTTGLRWYLLLRWTAAMRRFRRSTLRYRFEQERIERWLGLIRAAASDDVTFAAEIACSRRLIKGYSDTLERSLEKFRVVQEAAASLIGKPGAEDRLRELCEAALADEDGHVLRATIAAGAHATG